METLHPNPQGHQPPLNRNIGGIPLSEHLPPVTEGLHFVWKKRTRFCCRLKNFSTENGKNQSYTTYGYRPNRLIPVPFKESFVPQKYTIPLFWFLYGLCTMEILEDEYPPLRRWMGQTKWSRPTQHLLEEVCLESWRGKLFIFIWGLGVTKV